MLNDNFQPSNSDPERIDVVNDKILVWSNGQFIKCEDEPIHIPGKIQSYGALIAMKVDTWEIRQASENCLDIIGIDVKDLLKSESLRDFTDDVNRAKIENQIKLITAMPINNTAENIDEAGCFVFPFQFCVNTPPIHLIAGLHIHESDPEMVILEFELENDQKFPLNAAPQLLKHNFFNFETGGGDEVPVNSISESFGKTASIEKLNAVEMFGLMNRVSSFLNRKIGTTEICKEAVSILRNLTGFERTLIYEFDSDWNGAVIAESLSEPGIPSFNGLHFPHTDIPPQARALYLKNKIRLIYSVGLPTARILCRESKDLEKPLDLSDSYLRAMSPIHVKYLQNMGLESSMSISIVCFGKLWGLISFHGHIPRRISLIGRKFCRMIGNMISKIIESQLSLTKMQTRQLITEKAAEKIATDKHVKEYIIAKADDLLELLKSDFAVVSIANETKIIGLDDTHADTSQIFQLAKYLKTKKYSHIVYTDNIRIKWGDCPVNSPLMSGCFHIPLSIEGQDFITFMRKEQVSNVHWAGKPVRDAENVLEPRNSFKTWTEIVSGRARVWTNEELEIGSILQLVYWKFIDIWRQKDEALNTNKLKNLLLANVSHEVRTPLNAIVNYLEIALEHQMSEDVRSALNQSHESSKSLVVIVNDLLDLTKTEAEKLIFRNDPLHILTIVKDVIDIFKLEGGSKEMKLDLKADENLPTILFGDSSKIKQILINLYACMLKTNNTGLLKIHLSKISENENVALIQVSLLSDRNDMPNYSKEPRNIEYDESVISVVRKITENMDGKLTIEKHEGKIILQIPLFLKSNDHGKLIMKDGIILNQRKNLEKSKSLKRVSEIGQRDSVLEVLYAEDNIINQQILNKRLPSAKYNILCCNDGRECVEIFSNSPKHFDVILMDGFLPIYSGNEATKKIREIEKSRMEDCGKLPISHKMNGNRIPIFAVTGCNFQEEILEFKISGMDGLISKPVDMKILMEVLDSVKDGNRELLIDSVTCKQGWF